MELIVRRYGAPERRVTLAPDDFVASGGEGVVHARDGLAFKLYTDPATMPPAAKLATLRRLADRRLVTPTGTVHAPDGRAIGVCMPFIADAHPFARLATRSFCRQHGIDPPQVIALLESLRHAIAAAHRAGVHIVDLNPYNILVVGGGTDVALIDADSWQTPRHPATAVLDAVRDRHATRFDAASDWFSFAVLAAWTLLGVHPYKGTHPDLQGLDARMLAHASVFDPAVRTPPCARDPDTLPPMLRMWLIAVLEQGERTAPPPLDQSGFQLQSTPERPSAGLVLTEVIVADAPVEACVEAGGVRWWITRGGIFRDGRRIAPRPAGRIALAAGRRVLAAGCAGGRLTVVDAEDGTPLQCVLAARTVTSVGPDLVALTHDALVRLRPVGRAIAPEVLARVRPATRLFDGVALQPLPSGVEAIVPRSGGGVARVRLPIRLSRVADARADGGLLRVVGPDHSWTVRFDARQTDVREDTGEGAEADLVTLPQGLSLIRRGGDRVALEPAAPGAQRARVVEDTAWIGAQLIRLDTAVGLIRGRRVWRARLR